MLHQATCKPRASIEAGADGVPGSIVCCVCGSRSWSLRELCDRVAAVRAYIPGLPPPDRTRMIRIRRMTSHC